MKQTITGLILLLLINQVQAGAVEVVKAEADCVNNLCDFGVTLRHDDAGSDHYADRWEILSMNGDVLVRAHDSRHGYGGSSELVVRLRADEN